LSIQKQVSRRSGKKNRTDLYFEKHEVFPMQLAPPRGTRDFYPDEMRIRTRLFSIWRDTALRSGFEEYDSSILEHEELYVIKSGPEILGQLFNFSDKGGRNVSLRPEMTPTLARMVASKGHALPKPIKWFSIAQCFRYERMSRGRKREHFQWNLDILGVPEVTAEAELLATALSCLEQLGLNGSDVVVRISHRGLLGNVLGGLQVPEDDWAEVFGIIDKRGKESDESLWQQLEKLGLSPAVLEKLFSLLDQKRIDVFKEFLDEKGMDTASLEELQGLFTLMKGYGYEEYCEFAPSIVRGLPYYTGIVFECFDREGRFRAVFGGGRYNNLLKLFSAENQPAAGMGFGDVVIQEILEQNGKLPQLPRSVEFFVVPFSRDERLEAVEVVQAIRKRGIAADILLTPKKLKAALKEASRVRSKGVILLLPEELKEGMLVMKNLETGTEVRLEKADFLQDPGRFISS